MSYWSLISNCIFRDRRYFEYCWKRRHVTVTDHQVQVVTLVVWVTVRWRSGLGLRVRTSWWWLVTHDSDYDPREDLDSDRSPAAASLIELQVTNSLWNISLSVGGCLNTEYCAGGPGPASRLLTQAQFWVQWRVVQNLVTGTSDPADSWLVTALIFSEISQQ